MVVPVVAHPDLVSIDGSRDGLTANNPHRATVALPLRFSGLVVTRGDMGRRAMHLSIEPMGDRLGRRRDCSEYAAEGDCHSNMFVHVHFSRLASESSEFGT